MSFVFHVDCYKMCNLARSRECFWALYFCNKRDWDDRGATVYDSGVLGTE